MIYTDNEKLIIWGDFFLLFMGVISCHTDIPMCCRITVFIDLFIAIILYNE